MDAPPFSKFDPTRVPPPPSEEARSAHRRSTLLRYGQWISLAFLLFGFVVIGYVMLTQRR
jgi:hypothetical protein